MASTVAGIPFNIATSSSTVATNNGTKLSNDDFMRILLAEMSSPNIGSLLGGNENTGSTNSLFGDSSLSSLLALSNPTLLNQSLSGSSYPAIAEIPLLSLLIGKEIKALDTNNSELSGTVQRVLMQDGIAMVDIGDSVIDPSSITEVK